MKKIHLTDARFATAITDMFSKMDRLLPVSDIATMVRRLFSRPTNRKRRMHDVNQF